MRSPPRVWHTLGPVAEEQRDLVGTGTTWAPTPADLASCPREEDSSRARKATHRAQVGKGQTKMLERWGGGPGLAFQYGGGAGRE